MFPTYKIEQLKANRIIHLEESYLTELKSKKISPSKLSETVSSFANSAGGDIYIGIDEDTKKKTRAWNGFESLEEANDIFHTLNESHNLCNHVLFEFLYCDSFSGYVLHITVRKVKDIVKSSKSEIFIRLNASKLRLTTNAQIKKLELDKGIVTFEDEWINLDLRRVENSNSIIEFMLNIIPDAEPLTYLKNQELVTQDQVKVTGVLLFCDEPSIYLPKRCSVKLMRYKTKEDEPEREHLMGVPKTIEGDAYHLIYKSVKETIKMIEEFQRLGKHGFEKIQYPQETLHEIITNAILHRDYSITSDVQIRIFDNRIEVESPGKLPGHVTVKNILDTQSARNPNLIRLINKFPEPPNKDVGEGLDTAFQAMKKLRLKVPIITEKESSVLVTIVHESLATPEEQVMRYLSTHSEVTNKIAREITGIKSENSMKAVFLRLKDKEMIEQIPGRRGAASAWQIPESSKKVVTAKLFELDFNKSGTTEVSRLVDYIKPNNLDGLKIDGTEYIPLLYTALICRVAINHVYSAGIELTGMLNNYIVGSDNIKYTNNVSRALRSEKLKSQKWLKIIKSRSSKHNLFSLNLGWEDYWELYFESPLPFDVVVLVNNRIEKELKSQNEFDI